MTSATPGTPSGSPADLPMYVRLGGKGLDAERLARTEWLLTNGNGGFAMGTVLGAPSRRYHGLLVAPLRPPVQRVMALNALSETLVIDEGGHGEARHDLSTFRFRPGVLHPRGDAHLVKFEKGTTARWTYSVAGVTVVKTLHLLREAPAAAVEYEVRVDGARSPGGKGQGGGGGGGGVKLLVRPLVSLRDFHALVLRDTSRDRYRVEAGGDGCVVHGPMAALHLHAGVSRGTGASAAFERDEQWWYDFQYEHERERGYDYLEDLFHPGAFVLGVGPGQSESAFTIHAGMNDATRRDAAEDDRHRRTRLASLIGATSRALGGKRASPTLAALVQAADDFVVRRPAREGVPARTSIIAGYPWFADWGRDAMISLPGLLLAPGRFEEARDVLLTFANNRRGGLIPNLFDDYTGEAHDNTVDASLWFVHAACLYRRESDDAITFQNELLPACLDVVAHYRRGTSYGIRMDEADALIMAGDASTQLTWMDAKRDGVAFTPRHGKAVEINALWYNALAWLADLATGSPEAADLAMLRDRVGESMRRLFWNASLGCLYDSLQSPHFGAGWIPQAEVRPNQVFAVSLPHCALEPGQQRSVVEYVRNRLLTRRAVRTLDPADSRYRGRYRGRMFERDASYHNGTAWPWLLGPLAEAILRVGGFSPAAKAEARKVLDGILAFLDEDCPGQVPEVFDGDDLPAEPQHAGGCPAQAWSVAEPLRVLAMIERA
ncbi:MAG: glycogen debranching enzyme family protein [Phycisphaerae bacterium]|nr:glycogen debranching enzyme family protein [Phycisphaerae bacterium]